MKEYKTFETERLIIRPTTGVDAAFIYDLFNSPKWIAFIGDRNINSIEDAKVYIEAKMVSQLKRLGFSNYTLIRKEDNCKIGTCGLYDRDGLEGIDIGFAFLPQYERKGYAFEASNKLKHVAFSEFKLPSVNAITRRDNKASQKLLEKLGMKPNGIARLPNDDEDWLLYTVKM